MAPYVALTVALVVLVAPTTAVNAPDDLEALKERSMSSDDAVPDTMNLRSIRHLQSSGLQSASSADLTAAWNSGGRVVTGERFSYLGGTGELDYSKLDFGNPDNLVINNLGGQGPNFDHPCAQLIKRTRIEPYPPLTCARVHSRLLCAQSTHSNDQHRHATWAQH